jgi:hypothetical protein
MLRIITAPVLLLLLLNNCARDTKSAQAAPTGMVYIPGGTFVMGSDAKDVLKHEGPAHEVTVRNVETTEVTTCTLDDSLHHVLELMRRARVRRLPVVDSEGGLAGIVTLSDVAARGDKGSRGEIVATIQALRSPQRAAA